MRFLFTTLQGVESDFYLRVGEGLESRGHEVEHVVYSRAWTQRLRQRGAKARCLRADLDAVTISDLDTEAERIAREYDTPTVRDVWRTDPAVAGLDERASLERTVRHFLAFERILDEVRPDVLVPEVGSESMRTAAHLVGLRRGVRVMFLFYTIFRDPLRLYEGTMHAPIVPAEEVRTLTPAERAEIDGFIAEFTSRAAPIRPHRRVPLTVRRLPASIQHLRDRHGADRDNEYLTPGGWARGQALELVRKRLARRLYDKPQQAGRPFVYFPLHVVDDYKIKRVIPHCYHQEAIVEQIAEALPHGYDLVLKEHPMSVGRNRLALLHRLASIPNARLVDPHTSSHDLMKDAAAIAVISSTVGLEALMYDKPVLTLGQPFYGGYGITLDVDSFREISEAVPALLAFRPDHDRIRQFLHAAMRRCYPGAPALVDHSDENAERMAGSLDRAAREGVAQAEAANH